MSGVWIVLGSHQDTIKSEKVKFHYNIKKYTFLIIHIWHSDHLRKTLKHVTTKHPAIYILQTSDLFKYFTSLRKFQEHTQHSFVHQKAMSKILLILTQQMMMNCLIHHMAQAYASNICTVIRAYK